MIRFRRWRPLRLLAIGLVALGGWLVSWDRDATVPARYRTNQLEFTSLGAPRLASGNVELAGAWLVTSDDRRFEGYSALVAMAPDRLIAFTDNAAWLSFSPPGTPGREFHRFGRLPYEGDKFSNDIEGATHDPVSGRFWLSAEGTNTIRRYGPKLQRMESIAPPQMHGFARNGGAETLLRLRDGRFLVLQETARWKTPMRRIGLLFPKDPLSGAKATEFVFRPPPGYDPTDATQLPDGRVLILLRAIRLGGRSLFATKILVADPREIAPGKAWPWRELVDVSSIAPRENYEGLAMVPEGKDIALWLISDANNAVLIQHTQLLKLVWKGGAAPGAPAS